MVCYESKKLNEHEQDYMTNHLDLEVIIHALKIGQHYLLDKRFVLMSDQSGYK